VDSGGVGERVVAFGGRCGGGLKSGEVKSTVAGGKLACLIQEVTLA